MTARADRGKTLAGRLRDRIGCIDGWYDDASGELVSPLTEIAADVAELEEQSAKLRELCTALYKCRDKVSECGTCEDVECPFVDDCRLHDRMRELGVE